MRKHKPILYLLSAFILLASSFTAISVSHAQRDSLSTRSSEMSKATMSKATINEATKHMARVGKKAPNFTLVDQYGKKHSLEDYLGKTVVLEWVNPKCPFVVRHYNDGTTVDIQKQFAGKKDNVVWLRINSTSESHRDFLSAKETQAWAKDKNVKGLILGDPNGLVGHMYGAKSTPNMFVIDKSGKLVFSGAMDDDPYGKKKTTERDNYVANILAAWSAGEDVKPFANDSYGCSIKYSKH